MACQRESAHTTIKSTQEDSCYNENVVYLLLKKFDKLIHTLLHCTLARLQHEVRVLWWLIGTVDTSETCSVDVNAHYELSWIDKTLVHHNANKLCRSLSLFPLTLSLPFLLSLPLPLPHSPCLSPSLPPSHSLSPQQCVAIYNNMSVSMYNLSICVQCISHYE